MLSETIKQKIENALIVFPFWPHVESTKGKKNTNSYKENCVHSDITFWSENHVFMLLSSAHLFRFFFIGLHLCF